VEPRNDADLDLLALVFSGLTRSFPDGTIGPDLAESWTISSDGKVYTFTLRKGVRFHNKPPVNGRELTAEDVKYSFDRFMAKSAFRTRFEPVTSVDVVDKYTVRVTLKEPYAPFLNHLANPSFCAILPREAEEKFKDFNNPDAVIGTGPFVLKSFEPGVRVTFERNLHYFRAGRPYADDVEILAVNDGTARLSALQSGSVDVVNRVENRLAPRLQDQPGIDVIVSPSRTHYCFVMDTRVAPFSDPKVRLALKYAIDREAILKNVLAGYGSIGNDHSIPEGDPFHADLPQHGYDPEKARALLKDAGHDGLKIELSAADGAFAGAVDMALLFAQSAKEASIDVTVKREADDSYWDVIWMKKPFYMSWFGGRPTADMMLTLAYQSKSSWNDTFFSDAKFDELLAAARVSQDEAKRREMYAELQRIVWEKGGYLIPAFTNTIDACASRVRGLQPNINSELMAGRIGEYVWLQS